MYISFSNVLVCVSVCTCLCMKKILKQQLVYPSQLDLHVMYSFIFILFQIARILYCEPYRHYIQKKKKKKVFSSGKLICSRL